MEFGMFFLLQYPEGKKRDDQVFHEAMEQILAAEELGYAAVWLAEHHFSGHGICGSPLLLAAAAATRTKRVRLGTAISTLPFAHPVRLAEEAAVIDILSNGRLNFGVGRGYQKQEYEGFEISQEESHGRFYEALDLILRAWTQPRVTFEGKFYHTYRLAVLPKPAQKPHPPILVATVTPSSAVFAARRGFPLIAGFGSLAELIESRTAYAQTWADAGRHPEEIRYFLNRRVFVADSVEEARHETEDSLLWGNVYQGRYAGPVAPGEPEHPEFMGYGPRWDRLLQTSGDAFFDEWGLLGDPETIVQRIQRFEQTLGVTHLMCNMAFGWIEHAKVLRSMERFAREVMPHFQHSAISDQQSGKSRHPGI
ncbi:MAG: LLM class flavin-dependent oxidoreductase [Nitrospinae bacterium]|nr:LLM class flavin-dependent oxidoreductase [Nitrospinota bacterium]